MKVKLLYRKGDWKEVRRRCRTTIGKEDDGKEPSTSWKDRMLKACHSPIRSLTYNFYIEDIPSYVATHFARHSIGFEKYISTNREDRTGIKREDRKQTDPVNMEIEANAEALINVSRKRLCKQADKNTREVMQMMKDEVKKVEPIVAHNMVPDCIYKSKCTEFKSCGYNKTEEFDKELEEYLRELTDEDLEFLENNSLDELDI